MKRSSAAHSLRLKGNKYGLKLKDPDVRQRAYQKYCEWLAKGKSSRSFTFEEDGLSCIGETIESYIKSCPDEFSAIKRQIAYSKGYAHWEAICEGTADGSNKQACVPALNMVMRNKYDWDKEEKPQQQSASEIAKVIIADMDKLGGNHSESEADRELLPSDSEDQLVDWSRQVRQDI